MEKLAIEVGQAKDEESTLTLFSIHCDDRESQHSREHSRCDDDSSHHATR